MAVSGITVICIDTDEITVHIDPYLIETKSKEEVARMVEQAISEKLERLGVNRKFRRAKERGDPYDYKQHMVCRVLEPGHRALGICGRVHRALPAREAEVLRADRSSDTMPDAEKSRLGPGDEVSLLPL